VTIAGQAPRGRSSNRSRRCSLFCRPRPAATTGGNPNCTRSAARDDSHAASVGAGFEFGIPPGRHDDPHPAPYPAFRTLPDPFGRLGTPARSPRDRLPPSVGPLSPSDGRRPASSASRSRPDDPGTTSANSFVCLAKQFEHPTNSRASLARPRPGRSAPRAPNDTPRLPDDRLPQYRHDALAAPDAPFPPSAIPLPAPTNR
jgi:hypothetical protein